ncbi:hypothetical protein CK203_094832 [Vitis vinifera]|uniref:Uncharacterized protein n=1 Tax=Vitis vinifera TaxID=29760 RepID=A0A438DCG6_VITVI|nr:hypothetical protein CK203_094832 [Vitis vinifera]
MYTLNENVDVQAKMATLSRRLEELEARGAHEIKVVNDVPMQIFQCSICQSIEHLVSECPTIPTVREMFMEQANAIGFVKHSNSFPFSNTFNPGWRNHPNLSWNNGQGQFSSNMQTSQPQASPVEQTIVNLSKVMGDFIGDQKKKGKFPSQPQQNPGGFMKLEKKNENFVKLDEVKAIITLRGEKEKEVNEDDRSKQDEIVNEEVKKKYKLLSPPFPKALQSRKVVNNATKIFEVLKQVKVNISLLDMINQVPPYAKFLKDLCTMKRGLNINKKAFLTEQVSATIQCKTPIKYKDPGCPTISVNIGDTYVEKALLNLGASVNLLPYSVYKQLGLRELKPNSITLSLADRSIKIPRGMIGDILVQVDKFYYPVDFIILDTEPIASGPNHVPIILGKPFLAIENVLINFRSGVMQLTFGNMTIELNIFHSCKKHGTKEDEELKEAYLIELTMEELVKEKVEDYFSKLGEAISNERIEVWRINEEIQTLKLMKWSFSFKEVKTMKHGMHNNQRPWKEAQGMA